MAESSDNPRTRHRIRSAVLWILSIGITMGCITYQDKTGPTYPLDGTVSTANGPVSYKCSRSETIGSPLAIVLRSPVPEGVVGSVKYRRHKSHDEWTVLPMEQGEFKIAHRGRPQTLQGLGAALPGLAERAGKYEFFIQVDDGSGLQSVTGEQAILARYKAPVPGWALAPHIFAIFLSMALAIRTTLEALVKGSYRWMLWATTGTLLLGGFVLGPLVQWFAFGVWWSGIPFGFDWTDNKVLVELVFWVVALLTNRGQRFHRTWVLAAGIVTLLVYFIPHSIFGSEFDYRTGTGRGTTG